MSPINFHLNPHEQLNIPQVPCVLNIPEEVSVKRYSALFKEMASSQGRAPGQGREDG